MMKTSDRWLRSSEMTKKGPWFLPCQQFKLCRKKDILPTHNSLFMNIERNEDFSEKFSFSYLNNAQENCNLDFFYTLKFLMGGHCNNIQSGPSFKPLGLPSMEALCHISHKLTCTQHFQPHDSGFYPQFLLSNSIPDIPSSLVVQFPIPLYTHPWNIHLLVR